jgi:pyruvate oxidase
LAPGYDDGVESFAVEEREDGVYVGLPRETEPVRTVADLMMETMVHWGVKQVFGMVGHSNVGVADASRVQEAAASVFSFEARRTPVPYSERLS